jgi:anti-sigma factor RsiW
MREEHLHVSDEELLLYAGKEMSKSFHGQIEAHLENCSTCRTRLELLESTLAEFNEAHRQAWDTDLPPASAPRAALKARLAELVERERGNRWWWGAWIGLVERRWAVMLVGAASVACLLLAVRLYGPLGKPEPMTASLGHWEEPNLRLTPGATVPVTEDEVCGDDAAKTVPAVSVSLKRKVFELYGVTRQPDAYEVDYLITPELGGATDIRNLWPEPYQNTVWNAHVKDQLEDRLHRMVCRGDLDLTTAQHDISTDWIGAYRKYFHADRPVEEGSSSKSVDVSGPYPRT